MRNFQSIIFLLGVIYVLNHFIALLNAINSGNNPPIHPNPNTFTTENIVNGFTGFGFGNLFLIEIFTWWAWIPVSKQEISNNEHEKTYFSKSEHKSIQMENQTSLPLKMLSLELSSTGKSVPVTEIFSQSSFTGPDQDISVS